MRITDYSPAGRFSPHRLGTHKIKTVFDNRPRAGNSAAHANRRASFETPSERESVTKPSSGPPQATALPGHKARNSVLPGESLADRTPACPSAKTAGRSYPAATGSWGSTRRSRPASKAGETRRAVAVVEFALVAPVFFLLILGMIEFGRMVMVQQVITNASREGARRAVVDGVTTSQVLAVVEDYLAGGSISGASVTVNPDPIDSAGFGEPVTVTVVVPFRQVSWLPTPMFLGDTTLRARTTMRREAIQ